MPGYSYSGILSAGVQFTPASVKMNLGTSVHNYLLTPEEYNHENVTTVKPIAVALKTAIKPLLKYLEPEIAVTADFVHNGFIMPYKGRIDLGIPKRIVIDVKISEMPIKKGIEYFGYDKQLSGYALAIEAPVAIIVSVHPKTYQVTVTNIPISSDFWEYQIVQKGEPII